MSPPARYSLSPGRSPSGAYANEYGSTPSTPRHVHWSDTLATPPSASVGAEVERRRRLEAELREVDVALASRELAYENHMAELQQSRAAVSSRLRRTSPRDGGASPPRSRSSLLRMEAILAAKETELASLRETCAASWSAQSLAENELELGKQRLSLVNKECDDLSQEIERVQGKMLREEMTLKATIDVSDERVRLATDRATQAYRLAQETQDQLHRLRVLSV